MKILLAVFAGLASFASAGTGVRTALKGSVPLSSSDSITSLTRISSSRLGVDMIDLDSDKRHTETADLSPDAMQNVLEAAAIEGLSFLAELGLDAGPRGAIGQLHDDMTEANRAGRRRRQPDASPRVEADVMVIAAGRDKQRAVAVALHDLEAEDAGIERLRVGEIRDAQMHVAHHGARGDARVRKALNVFTVRAVDLAQ